MVNGEDHMIIVNRQHPDLLRFEPLRLFKRAALWTMPIFAWFIAELPAFTFDASLQDSTESRRAAIQNGAHGFRLFIGKPMSAFVIANVFAEDVSHIVFHPWLLR